jgi:hypothetical protein
MKRLLVVAIIALVSVSAKAQKISSLALDTTASVSGNYQLHEVVNADALKKEQLYKNAKLYFMDVFAGAKDAFQYDDKQEGKIIGKGFLMIDDYKTVFPGVAALKWDVYYNTEIICKDGKYSVRVYDIVITRESHVAENNYRNVHFTLKDAYAAIPKQRGPYKELYAKVINKMIGEFNANISTIEENMAKKQPDYAAF